MSKLPHQIKPCKDCPFRKDTLKGWLGENRITDILSQNSFVCHKNIKLQCAGHMILSSENNSFVRLAKRLNLNLNLIGHELVFESKQECINHHKK